MLDLLRDPAFIERVMKKVQENTEKAQGSEKKLDDRLKKSFPDKKDQETMKKNIMALVKAYTDKVKSRLADLEKSEAPEKEAPEKEAPEKEEGSAEEGGRRIKRAPAKKKKGRPRTRGLRKK